LEKRNKDPQDASLSPAQKTEDSDQMEIVEVSNKQDDESLQSSQQQQQQFLCSGTFWVEGKLQTLKVCLNHKSGNSGPNLEVDDLAKEG